jgi:hypothetical protein
MAIIEDETPTYLGFEYSRYGGLGGLGGVPVPSQAERDAIFIRQLRAFAEMKGLQTDVTGKWVLQTLRIAAEEHPQMQKNPPKRGRREKEGVALQLLLGTVDDAEAYAAWRELASENERRVLSGERKKSTRQFCIDLAQRSGRQKDDRTFDAYVKGWQRRLGEINKIHGNVSR